MLRSWDPHPGRRSPGHGSVRLPANFRRKLRVAILLLVAGVMPAGNRDAGKFTADATQLPTGCQPESLAKPARRPLIGITTARCASRYLPTLDIARRERSSVNTCPLCAILNSILILIQASLWPTRKIDFNSSLAFRNLRCTFDGRTCAWLALLLNRQQHFNLFAHSTRRAPLERRAQLSTMPMRMIERGGATSLRCSGARRTTAARQLCKRDVDVYAREDSMGAVWAYVEYGWNLNPQIGLKATESGAHNPIGIDGINA